MAENEVEEAARSILEAGSSGIAETETKIKETGADLESLTIRFKAGAVSIRDYLDEAGKLQAQLDRLAATYALAEDAVGKYGSAAAAASVLAARKQPTPAPNPAAEVSHEGAGDTKGTAPARPTQEAASSGTAAIRNPIEALGQAIPGLLKEPMALLRSLPETLNAVGGDLTAFGGIVLEAFRGFTQGANEVPRATTALGRIDERVREVTQRLADYRDQQSLTNQELRTYHQLSEEQVRLEILKSQAIEARIRLDRPDNRRANDPNRRDEPTARTFNPPREGSGLARSVEKTDPRDRRDPSDEPPAAARRDPSKPRTARHDPSRGTGTRWPNAAPVRDDEPPRRVEEPTEPAAEEPNAAVARSGSPPQPRPDVVNEATTAPFETGGPDASQPPSLGLDPQAFWAQLAENLKNRTQGQADERAREATDIAAMLARNFPEVQPSARDQPDVGEPRPRGNPDPSGRPQPRSSRDRDFADTTSAGPPDRTGAEPEPSERSPTPGERPRDEPETGSEGRWIPIRPRAATEILPFSPDPSRAAASRDEPPTGPADEDPNRQGPRPDQREQQPRGGARGPEPRDAVKAPGSARASEDMTSALDGVLTQIQNIQETVAGTQAVLSRTLARIARIEANTARLNQNNSQLNQRAGEMSPTALSFTGGM